tara:strand:+ start:8856 stop:11609 length:2754 start_codon:yes stop_codon:yes gene_type:complete
MSELHNYLKGDASTPKAPTTNEDWGSLSPGPYVGIVKANNDPLRAGRLKVFIPSLKGNVSTDFDGLIDCDYLSPFYGNKGLRHVKPGNKHTDSQFSYGFWAVPPDLETRVLVIFAEGKMEEAFWIGCVQEPLTNHMTPGIASSQQVTDELGGNTLEEYGSLNLPAGEVNRYVDVDQNNYTTKGKPVHPLADTLMKQGLSSDNIRGNTTSSAQRESPSQVFGLSTPGRLNPGATPTKIGANDSEEEAIVDRLTGHTFVMDDGAEDGSNQLTRLRTSSGHQLLMHDSEGIVYIANGSGNAWIEMNSDGRIDIYSGVGGINMRTQGDFNLHADANINMHAGQSIRMSAPGSDDVFYSADDISVKKGQKSTADIKVPRRPGEIYLSTDYLQTMADKGLFTSSQNGQISMYSKGGMFSYTDGQILAGAGGQIHLAGAQVHFNSIGASKEWGPHWLTPEKVGMEPRLEGDVELAKKGIEPLRPFTKQTKTTVHRFITHEPVPRFKGFSTDGALPSLDPTDDQMDTKMWSKLSRTPGTTEYTEQRNRLSSNETIRLGQFQADAERVLRQKMGTSTSGTDARKILQEFGKDYDKMFNIESMMKGKWDKANSISQKLGDFNISDSVNSVVNNTTKKLADQVIDTVTGSKAAEMFKDNVFVNQAGELFALGGGADFSKLAAGNVKGFATDVGSKALANVANEAFKKNVVGNLTKKAIGVDKFGNTIYSRTGILPAKIGNIDVSGIVGNINIANLASIGDLKATTNVFKNVVAGQVTSAVTQTAISAVKSQASSFITGLLGKSTARELARTGGVNAMSSLGLKIGSTALPKFLGGKTISTALSSIGKSAVGKFFSSGFSFSDVRLKEQIRFVGKSPTGINIYSFKYKQLPGRYIGVMAQEVPWARHMTDTGYYAVDYSKVDVKFRRLQ